MELIGRGMVNQSDKKMQKRYEEMEDFKTSVELWLPLISFCEDLTETGTHAVDFESTRAKVL
jgi:hypothetical protein